MKCKDVCAFGARNCATKRNHLSEAHRNEGLIGWYTGKLARNVIREKADSCACPSINGVRGKRRAI